MDILIDEFLRTSLTLKAIGAIFVIALLIQLFYYLYYYTGVWSLARKINKGNNPYDKQRPPVSVIICAKNEADNLEKFLPSILEQDYPEFEVIVVNDGSTDESSNLLEHLQLKHKNLYQTFLPMEAKYHSRKKACLTVGIKAARYEHLLFTEADCQPNSKFWISNMVQNFTPKTEIVLGYSSYEKKEGFLNAMLNYDNIFNAMQFMGFARKGKTYMGTSRNLAYKKELFFKNKSFASHLDLTLGDDDIHIQQISTPENVQIEFFHNGAMTSFREHTYKTFFAEKDMRMYTGLRYNARTKSLIRTELTSRFLSYILAIVLIPAFLFNSLFIMAGITAGLFLLRFITQLCVINSTCKCLHEKSKIFSIPLFDLLLPSITLYLYSVRNFTRPKVAQWGA